MTEPTDAQNPNEEEGKEVELVWVGRDEIPPVAPNKVISQFYQDMFVVTLGVVNQPILLGSPEVRKAKIEKIEEVTVTALTRFALTEHMMVEVISALSENLSNYRAQRAKHAETDAEQEGRGQ